MISIGQRLRQARLQKKLSFEEVAKATKIKVSFLSAIEKGEYHKLPSSAYAQGFVKNYAKFLGLPPAETLALFKREFEEEKVFRVLPEGFTKMRDYSYRKARLAPAFFLGVCIFLVLLGYIAFQYRFAFLNPPLEIIEPKENQLLQEEQFEIIGKTDPNATVFVNESAVTVGKDGMFRKKLELFTGKSTIKIKAVNRLGKETIIERHIEVKPES